MKKKTMILMAVGALVLSLGFGISARSIKPITPPFGLINLK